METDLRVPVLKGKPFFDQLRIAINFIDSNMKLIDNSVRTSNTDEEYNYVKAVLGKVAKYNDDVNAAARCLKTNNLLKRSASEFEDEVQNLKEMLRCKEIDYRLEPFKYPTAYQGNGVQAGGSLNGHKQQSIQQVQAPNSQFGQLPAQERRVQFLNRNHQFGKGVLNHLSNSASKYNQTNSNKPNDAYKTANPPSYQHHTDTYPAESRENRLGTNHRAADSKISCAQTINLNHLNFNSHPHQLSSKNKCSSIKKKDTFLLKGDGPADVQLLKKPEPKFGILKKEQPKDSQADLTNESIDPSNQFSFDFKLPYNKLKNNYYPSSSNFSVDESLEIEFTPGLKSRRTCKKPPTLNESNASTQDLQSFDKQGLQFDNRDNSIRSDISLSRPEVPAKADLLADKLEASYPRSDARPENRLRPDARSDAGDKENRLNQPDCAFTKPEPLKLELRSESRSPTKIPAQFEARFDLKVKSQKLSTPKKPPNFDFLNF